MNKNNGQIKQSALKADHKKYQVIFINWFDRSADCILYETDEDWNRQLREEWIHNLLERHGVALNEKDFIGTGVSIYFCEQIDICGDDYDEADGNLKVERAGIDYEFWINDSSADFPLIEGSFMPGIYWEESQSIYYEINDLSGFSMLIGYFLDLILSIDQYKIVCRKDGAEMRALEDDTAHEFVHILGSYDTRENGSNKNLTAWNTTAPHASKFDYEYVLGATNASRNAYNVFDGVKSKSAWNGAIPPSSTWWVRTVRMATN